MAHLTPCDNILPSVEDVADVDLMTQCSISSSNKREGVEVGKDEGYLSKDPCVETDSIWDSSSLSEAVPSVFANCQT